MKHLVSRQKHSKWVGKHCLEINSESRWNVHVPWLLFPPERRHWATAGLGSCRDVEMMLNFRGCSWLHFCTAFIPPKCCCSWGCFPAEGTQGGLCFSPLVFCFKETSWCIFSGSVSTEVDRGIQQRGITSRASKDTGTTHTQSSYLRDTRCNSACILSNPLDYDKI